MTIHDLERSPLHESVHHGYTQGAIGVAPRAGASRMTATLLSVTTRPMNDDDSMLLFELYAATRLDEISRSGWATPQQRSFFRMQAQIQEQYFARHHQYLDRRTICINEFGAGRLLVDQAPDGYTIVDIALLPSYRGRGIGTMLIAQLLDEATEAQVPVHGAMARCSPALERCRRMGFVEVEDLGQRVRLAWQPPAPGRGTRATGQLARLA